MLKRAVALRLPFNYTIAEEKATRHTIFQTKCLTFLSSLFQIMASSKKGSYTVPESSTGSHTVPERSEDTHTVLERSEGSHTVPERSESPHTVPECPHTVPESPHTVPERSEDAGTTLSVTNIFILQSE